MSIATDQNFVLGTCLGRWQPISFVVQISQNSKFIAGSVWILWFHDISCIISSYMAKSSLEKHIDLWPCKSPHKIPLRIKNSSNWRGNSSEQPPHVWFAAVHFPGVIIYIQEKHVDRWSSKHDGATYWFLMGTFGWLGKGPLGTLGCCGKNGPFLDSLGDGSSWFFSVTHDSGNVMYHNFSSKDQWLYIWVCTWAVLSDKKMSNKAGVEH